MEVKFTDYMTVPETAELWNVNIRMVQRYCASGRVPGALSVTNRWLIPRDAQKPADGRVNNRRQPKKTNAAGTEESSP